MTENVGSTVKWALVSDAIRGIGKMNVLKWETGRTSFLADDGDSGDDIDNTGSNVN